MTRALAIICLLAAPAAAAPAIRGVALGLYDDGDKSRDLADIAALGADTVSLVVSWKQHDVR